jgi:serine/threonine protein kinase
MLQLHRDYTAESFSAHELDGKVMERLTGSPHVVSSYGFCGQSVLTQIAENSGANVIKDSTLSWRERLSMGRDIAKGLAELHALEPWTDYDDIIQTLSQSSQPVVDLSARTSTTTSSRPAIFAHHDINGANMISLQPKQVHWNDFNLGILSKKNRATGQACHVPVRYEGVLWRSPEEIQNKLGNLSTLQPADIYSFGTMLFTVFTKHQPWTHLEEGEMTDEIIETKKKRGDLPHLPEKYQPQRLEAKILWAASKACFRRDPGDRPTAYHLALGLGLALERLQSHKELSDEDIENLFAA